MTDWQITIKKVENGYICEYPEQLDDDTEVIKMQVFEEEDKENGELEATKNMLWFVKEHFGINYSKHNKVNLDIKLEEMK